MSFSVTLNGEFLINEPKNLLDASVKIERDSVLPGLFQSFIADLEFWGDGYDILYAERTNNGLCAFIPISIVEDCAGGFEFDGLIYIRDIEYNTFKCTAKATIVDNTLQGLITRLKDTKVRINNGRTVSGDSLASIGTSLAAGGDVGTKQWYKALDAFQFTLNYITDNGITVESDFLTASGYDFTEIELACTSTGTSAAVVFLFTDIFGTPAQISFTIPALLTNEQYALYIAERLNTNNYFGQRGDFPVYADVKPFPDNTTVVVRFLHAMSFTTITTNGTGTITQTVIKTGSYGGDNIYITGGGNILTPGITPNVSFEDLVIGLGAFYNLGVSFRESGGTQYIKIDKEPEFYVDTQSASISDVPNTIERLDTPISFSSLNYRQNNRESRNPLFRPVSYINVACSEDSLSPNTTFQNPTGLFPSDIESVSIDDLFICESLDDANVLAIPSTLYDGASIVPISSTYGASTAHPFVAKNYVFRAPDGLEFEGKTVPNNNSIVIRASLECSGVLSRTQFNSVKANPSYYISINGIKCWIKNLEYQIKNGNTTFEMLIE